MSSFLVKILNFRYTLLYASVFLVPITFFLGKSSRVSFFPTYLIALCGLSLLISPEMKRVLKQNQTSLVLVTVFLAYLALSNFRLDNNLQSSGLYLGYAFLILSFVCSFGVLEQRFDRFFERFQMILVTSACLSVVYSVYVFHTLDYQPLPEQRLYALGGLHNPVVSALSYGAVALLCLTNFAHNPDRHQKILYGIALFVLLIGILYTGTRSVWIGLLVSSFVLLGLLPNLNKSRKRRIIIIAQLGFVVLLAVIWKFGLHEEILKRSTSFRLEIWTSVITKILAGPYLLGHGLNASEIVEYKHYVFEHPHSIYLATIFYGGLLGFALFLAYLVQLLLKVYKEALVPYNLYAIPALVYGLTCLFFDGDKLLTKINFIWLLFWLPYAMTLMQSTFENKLTEASAESR